MRHYFSSPHTLQGIFALLPVFLSPVLPAQTPSPTQNWTKPFLVHLQKTEKERKSLGKATSTFLQQYQESLKEFQALSRHQGKWSEGDLSRLQRALQRMRSALGGVLEVGPKIQKLYEDQFLVLVPALYEAHLRVFLAKSSAANGSKQKAARKTRELILLARRIQGCTDPVRKTRLMKIFRLKKMELDALGLGGKGGSGAIIKSQEAVYQGFQNLYDRIFTNYAAFASSLEKIRFLFSEYTQWSSWASDMAGLSGKGLSLDKFKDMPGPAEIRRVLGVNSLDPVMKGLAQGLLGEAPPDPAPPSNSLTQEVTRYAGMEVGSPEKVSQDRPSHPRPSLPEGGKSQ